MFSRNRFIRTIASVLIILMCMVMVPFATSDKVRADGPDKEFYSSAHVYDRKTIYAGKDSRTFLFLTENTMMYRFHMDEFSREHGYGDSATIAVYDTNSKLIKSSNEPDITVELKGNTEFFVVVSGAKPGAEIFFEYNFRLKVEKKEQGDDKYTTMPRSAYFWSTKYKGGSWDSYSVLEGSDVKLSLDVGELPSGIKLNYSWYRENDNSNEFKEKVNENAPISVNVPNDTDDYYLCKVQSTDGSVDTQFIFLLASYDLLKFKSDKSVEYKIQAFKPGEERRFDIPEFIYDGEKEEISYYFSELHDNAKHIGSETAPTSVPSDWKSSSVYCSIYGKNRSYEISFYGLFFVFADGDGIKAKAGETYHLDETSNKSEYEQAILSFTPDKTGTYDLTLSDYDESFMPVIAVFDPDRNVVAESFDTYMSEELDYKISDTHKLKVDLTAGKTYYIAVPINTSELNCNLSISKVSTPSTPAPSTTGGGFEDFVERLYTVALNRASEPEGKAFWCEHVGNGDLDGAQCAKEFLLSKEFNDRKLSDEEFLKVLYKTFFDRDAEKDPDGFNFWMNSLKTQGRDVVVDCFINSEEWCNVCASYGVRSGATRAKATIASANATAFATRLYTECLGRDPEEGGLKFWSLGLTNQELSGTQAAKEFFYSAEFVDAKYSNDEYINRMYKTFMGREAEAEGKAYWLDLMNNGTSRDEVFNFFSTCEEFTGICNQYAIVR